MLHIELEPTSFNGTCKFRVLTRLKAGGDVVDIDRCKGDDSTDRERVARRLQKKFGGTWKQIDDMLVAKVSEAIERATIGATANSTTLDISRIIRPELIYTPYVAGITVAEPSIIDGKPAGIWKMYLRWSHHVRGVRDLCSQLEVCEGVHYWIHPQPAPPPANLLPGWSAAARRRWLAGEPAPNAADVFKSLCEAINDYVYFPPEIAPGAIAMLALWIMFSYIFPVWDAVPYLYISGTLGSGKTRVFEILSRMVFRALLSSNMTAPALFRTLHDRGGTLLMDEAERLRDNTPDANETRSILLAGYKRNGKATRLEPSGDTFRTVEFDCYGPKALACIAGLTPALYSRCISLQMFKSPPGSPKPQRRIDEDPARWMDLRDSLHALALENGRTWALLAERRDIGPTMSGRNFELWQPLLALAEWVESQGAEGLLDVVMEYATSNIATGEDESVPDVDEVVLRLLAAEVLSMGSPTPGELLVKAQTGQDGELFKKWSAKGIANTLKRYRLQTVKARGRKVYRDVTVAQLRRIERHYSLDLLLPEEPPEDTPAPGISTYPKYPTDRAETPEMARSAEDE